MARQDNRRIGLSAVACVLWFGLWVPALADAPPAGKDTPASKPSKEQSDAEMQAKMELLRKLREQSEAASAAGEKQPEPKAPTAPETAPATRPKGQPRDMEALRRRALTSTQEAREDGRLVVEVEEDYFGPPYPPASPARGKRATTGPQTERGTEKELTPPVSKATDDLEWFNYDGMPWEDVIYDFAERIGKPLLVPDGELLIGGELTYKTDRKFTKEEAIDELNLIMQMIGYRFVETENHVFVVPLSEMPMYVPVEKTYPTREAFEQADPRPMDYVTVYVQVEGHPARKVQEMFETMLPDYMTVMAIEDTNQLKVVGLVRDVHKLLGLMDRVSIDERDPLVTRIFQIETNARDIERIVRDVLGIGGGTRPTVRIDPRTRRPVPTASSGRTDTSVHMTADDRTNTIIVRATPSKIKEIEELIKQVDKKPDLEFYTKVTEIKNANAVDVADLLNKILSQEQGTTTPAWQRVRQAQQAAQRRRGRRTPTRRTPTRTTQAGASPEELLGEGLFERAKKTIRIAADERTNSIIVYANKDGHERVAKLLEDIDKAQPSNLKTIAVENVEAAQIYPTLSQLVQNMASMARGRAPSIVLDEANNVFHVLAEREQMQQIEEVIARLDVPMPESERHVVELVNLLPSRVAQMIQPLLTSTPSSAGRPAGVSRLRGRRGRVGVGAAVSATESVQIVPLDEARLLIVVCPERLWEKVEETIKLWDERATTSTPQLQTYEIAKGDPQAIAATLNNMYRGQYSHPAFGRSQVAIEAQGGAVMVYAIEPAQKEIASLIEALDREDAKQYEILPLAHADATQVAQEAVQLFGGVARGRRGRGGLAGADIVIQAEPVTNSLIVQADATTLEKIKDYAMQRDQSVAAQVPERKFFTLRFAQPREVAQAVMTMFGGGSRRRGQPVGTQVKAVASGTQVIVEAPKEKMAEVEAFVAQLDDPRGAEIIIKTVKMPGVDVNQIARKLTNAFRQKKNVVALFDPDPTSETILLTCSRDALEEAERLLSEYETASRGAEMQVEFRQMNYAPAGDAANWLRDQLVTYIQKQYGRSAAAQIRVTADTRTNRVVINGPRVAVEYGKALLDQYDIQVEKQPEPPIVTEARKLPGLDVRNLAGQLNGIMRSRPRRPDGLRATFGYDAVTQTLIISAPKDMYDEINELINTFASETKDIQPEQKFIQIRKADANYVASQVQRLLIDKLSKTHGRDVAQRVSLTVDTRLNRVILNAPKFVIPMAESLIAELDQEPTTESQLRTIALENADANTVLSVLRTIFSEKIRAKTLQISVDPLTNSLIVGGTKEDYEDIEQWARDLDGRAAEEVSEPRIYELKNASPWDVYNVLQQTFVNKGAGRRLPPNKQIKISVVAGRSLVVQAPPEKLADIEKLINELDQIGRDVLTVRTYKLPGLGTQLNQFARQIQDAVNRRMSVREQRISVTPLPAADTLVVTAAERQFPEVEAAMEKFKDLYQPPKIETLPLEHGDANMVVQALNRVLQPKIRSGRVQISSEPTTNTIIVSAAEEDMAEIRAWVEKFDAAAAEAISPPQIFELKNANPWEVRNVLNATFVPRGTAARQRGKEVRFDVMGGRSIVAKAPAEMMKQIAELIEQLDAIGSNQAEVRTYELPGVGSRLNDLARQIRDSFNQGVQARERRISVTPYAPADALIVTALPDQFPKIEELMNQFKELVTTAKSKTAFYKLDYVDATQIVNLVRDMVQKRVQASGGKGAQDFSVSADPRTNRLIVFAPEAILPDVEAVVRELDVEVQDTDVVTIELQFADPWEVRNMINDVFGRVGSRRGSSAEQQVYVTVSNSTLIIKAPPKKLEKIEELIAQLDREDNQGLQIKTYALKLLNATQVATQVQMYLRQVMPVQRRGQMQPGAFAEPTTNTLVVIAPERYFPFIEGLVTKLESSGDQFASDVKAYELKHARAEQVAQNVDQMLKAKVQEREGQVRGRTAQMRTAVFSDVTSNRLFVYAPEEYQELARQLIEIIDQDIDTGEIVHIIQLEQADAQQLAQTLQQVIQGSAARGRGAPAGRQVRITADAGSNSILLCGLPKDVAEIEGYIAELERNSETVPELQIFQLKNVGALDAAETLNGIFGQTGRGGRRGGSAEQVTITPDDYYNRLFVTASKRKMRQVEALIEELDVAPEAGGEGGLVDPCGRELYFVDIYRGDAFDIAWDVNEMLPDPERCGPIVVSDLFGKYLKVKCRPGEFDQVLAMIRQFEQHAQVETKVVTRQLKGDPQSILAYLRKRMPEEDITIEYAPEEGPPPTIVESLYKEGEEPLWLQRQRERKQKREQPAAPAGEARPVKGKVRPFALGVPVTAVLLADIEPDLLGDEQPPAAAAPPATQPAPTGRKPAARGRLQETVRRTLPPGVRRAELEPAPAAGGAEEPAFRREKTRIVVQPDGSVVIYGPRSDVEEIEEAIDLLEEDLDVGEVIRIFEFKYGDVTAAAEVIQIMFNDRQMQRFIPQPPQPQRGRQGQRGEQGREGQAGTVEQLRGMIGGRATQRRTTPSGPRVRIATDPGHNYLIIKCNQSDLPEIKQLLRELDIPPGEVELKVFQLRNLDAAETAENIKEVLGITKVQSRRGRTAALPAGRGRRGGAQAQLMEMLQQQMVSVPGVEGGAKVEQVEIVPNSVTNSLMVSAPPEVMKIIANIITELEDLEGYDVVGIYHYPLEHAKVDDVLPLLQEIFSAAGGGGGGARGGRGGRGAARRSGALGPVTISGDPRVNTIIYTAQAKDKEIVEAQIRMLDIEGAIAEAELYVCEFGDAAAIADVIQAIYGGGGTARGRGARGGAQAALGGQEVRVVAEPATNTIIVWGPPDKRDEIFAKIQDLDLRGKRDIREIPVIYADPEQLAETLLQMFGGGGGTRAAAARRGGRRGGRSAAVGAGNIVIIGDKNARKLLVRAPEAVFAQIEEVVATLDQPNEQMQLRRFALKYADAEVVVESVKGALTEYLQMAGGRGGELPMDPFTAVADPRTNSVVVVGSQQTFAFVENVLATIDVETPAEQRSDFRVFVLERADAEFVAQAINDFAAGRSGASGGPQPRGRSGRRGQPAAGTLARELDVYASADTTANTVMVFGKAEDIDLVEDQIISQYEDAIRDRLQIATIPVQNVKPTEIVSFIWQFIGEPEAQAAGGRRTSTRRGGSRGGGESAGPQIIPNDNAGNLVVRGTRGDIEYIRELVEQFDNPGLIQTNIKVVKVPLGQDVNRLAADVERIVNDAEAERAAASGGRARQVSIAPDEYTNSLIVAGDPVMFGMVTSVIEQLSEIRRDNVVTRVINLGNLSAEDAKQMIEDLQRRGSSGSSGRRSVRPGRSSGSSRRSTGGGTRRSRSRRPGGDFEELWSRARPGPHAVGLPEATGGVYISPAVLQPGLGAVLAAELISSDPPPATRPGAKAGRSPARRPARQMRPTRRAAPKARPKMEKPADRTAAPSGRAARPAARERRPDEPATRPTPGLTGITGELRGEVIVSEIDSKRIMITGDESDVAFIEQILAMMEQSASPAVIEVFPIQNAKATALAPIIEEAIKAMIDVRTSSPGPEDRFSISAEGRSNSLIVSASEQLMNEIAALIEQLDVEKVDGVVPRAIALKHIRAADAVALLQPALEELYRIQEVPTESQASIRAIDRSNSVLILGTPKDFADIEQLLKTIDVEITAEDEQASFVYAEALVIPLKNGQAEDVAKVLTDMIEEQQQKAREAQSARDRGAAEPYVTKLRLRTADGRELPELDLERPIGIIPEKGTNSLIVFSSPKNNASLTEIVRLFDTLPVGAETELRTVTLKYAAAQDVAEVLSQVFEEGKKALARPVDGDRLPSDVMPPAPPTPTGEGLPYNLVVQHDVRSNTVILVGRKEAVMLASSLAMQLDQPSVKLTGKPYVIPLKNYQATQLQEKLKEMLDERAQALGADQNEARDSAVIIADERSNSLVVVTTPEVYDMIEEIATQLDAAQNYRIVATRYRRLEYADAQKLAGLLQELFDRKQEAESKQSNESKDTLDVIPDTRSNALVLVGTRDYLAEAVDLIDKLDQSFDRTVVMKIIPVRLNSAANIAVLLQDMVDQALKEQDSKLEGTPIHIAAEPLSDSLLLAASKEDMAMLERWVEILDRPSEVGRMFRIIPLARADAEEVARAAQDIFSKTGGDAKLDINVTNDPLTNSVVAFGPPAVLKDIEAFVKELDQVEPGSRAMVRIFKLTQADAEEAGDLLVSILESRSGTVGGGGRGGTGGRGSEEFDKLVKLFFQEEDGLTTLEALRKEIVVISDIRTNSLVVTAPPESMPLMEALVKQIDVPPEAAKVRVFALRNADAEQMVEMLRELFEERRTGGGGGEETQRELVLGESAVGGRQEVSFTTDLRTNSVIAAGTPGYLDLVEELILELDTKAIEDRKTMVYAPRNMVADTLAQAIRDYSDQEQQRLQELGDEISLAVRQEAEIGAIAHEESNRIILSYSPRKEQEVLDIVHSLDQPPPQVSIEVLIVEVAVDDALELGVEFAFQDLQYTKAGTNDTTTFDFVGGTDVGAAGAGLGGFTFTITGRDFNFLLRTLQSQSNLKVLSRPHIVAMDNQPASIEITDSVPYNSGTTVTTGGIAQTNISRQDVGIKLEVTPQINPDGFVRLEIRQEVSDVSDSNISIGPGVTAPIFNQRVAETVVTVQNNETVVLGGLIQSRESKIQQKIPLLGDLPLLGPLFRYQNDSDRRSELLLILTPRVIRTVDDYRELSVEARDQTGLITDDLKANPLMRRLRVSPEELVSPEGEDLLGPFEPSESAPPAEPREEYGPVRPRRHGDAGRESYDVPISMWSRKS